MLDFTFLTLLPEFSRQHCIAICAFLVPANLLATSQTLLFLWFQRPRKQISVITSVGCVYALLMLLHVLTWWMVGVVMIPTYVLTLLGSLCLGINLLAIAYRYKFATHPGINWATVKKLGLTQ